MHKWVSSAMFAASLLLVPCVASGADMRVVPGSDPTTTSLESWAHLNVVGEIVPGDAERLELLLRTVPKAFRIANTLSPLILMNSSGGDVGTALRMGDLLRRANATVTVLPGRECSSACIFILASGVSRMAVGSAKIGLHRPYFNERFFANLSVSQAQQKYSELESVVKRYLRDMGIPDSLFDRMRTIPSRRIEYLSEEELKSYMLDGKDVAAEELEQAQAKVSGPIEYEFHLSMQRCADAHSDFDTFQDCAVKADRVRKKAHQREELRQAHVPHFLPSWNVFLPAAKKDNPDVPERELRKYWEETYGKYGAKEKDPIVGRDKQNPDDLLRDVMKDIELPPNAPRYGDVNTRNQERSDLDAMLKKLVVPERDPPQVDTSQEIPNPVVAPKKRRSLSEELSEDLERELTPLRKN